ncbi:hypothetical protein ACJIZ3_019371 [Penstemon smallii]|uniref:DUF547 domain-containing protein n=1 Tax=Penstemon smallii TaxID=265156 RepID=A0ABD3T105_9LAMI
MELLRQNSNTTMDCNSPSPPPSTTASRFRSEICKDHVLNMSPRHSHHLDPISDCWESRKEQCVESIPSPLSDGKMTPKSSAELMKEIAALEVEIGRLESSLLSLYRKAFQQQIPRIQFEQQMTGTSPLVTFDQPSQKIKFGMTKDPDNHRCQSSPTSALAGPNDLVQNSISESSSEREKKSVNPRHLSFADHLGNSLINDAAIIFPDRLSEDIIRCISSIYCKLANPTPINKGYSISSTSSFCSSSTFSPRNLSGSWSPQCNHEVTEHCDFKGLKQENGPYAAMVEVLKICLDDDNYSYAATMLQKFSSLVKSLEIVDLKKMRREEKLVFWINIHNALMMHAYLAYGTQNYMKSNSMLKAAYNVGGHCINAYDIQNSILGIRSHYSAPWLQNLLSPGKKLKTGTTKHAYAIEYPEPLVYFALCSGSNSDPAVRVYTANSVFNDLKVAKEEFIQATVYVHKETKIYLPRILCYYAKDMSLCMTALLEMVSGCLSGIQQKAISKCVKGRPDKYVYWLEQSSSFRYLIHKEIADDKRWSC